MVVVLESEWQVLGDTHRPDVVVRSDEYEGAFTQLREPGFRRGKHAKGGISGYEWKYGPRQSDDI